MTINRLAEDTKKYHNGTYPRCDHGRAERYCVVCNPHLACEHGLVKSKCYQCSPARRSNEARSYARRALNGNPKHLPIWKLKEIEKDREFARATFEQESA